MDDVATQAPLSRILQARTLEWVAIPSSRGSSQPRDRTWVSCLAGRFFTREVKATAKMIIQDSVINQNIFGKRNLFSN